MSARTKAFGRSPLHSTPSTALSSPSFGWVPAKRDAAAPAQSVFGASALFSQISIHPEASTPRRAAESAKIRRRLDRILLSPADVEAVLEMLRAMPEPILSASLRTLPRDLFGAFLEGLETAPIDRFRREVLAACEAAPPDLLERVGDGVLAALDVADLRPRERSALEGVFARLPSSRRQSIFANDPRGPVLEGLLEESAREGEPELDPAEAVALARTDPLARLPHVEAVAERFEVPLDRIEVHLGDAARRAATLLGATAFAVDNVVVFGERWPTLARVIHEVAHVVQQGGHLRPGPKDRPLGSLALGAPFSAVESEAWEVAWGGPSELLHGITPALHRAGPDEDKSGDAQSAQTQVPKPYRERLTRFKNKTGPKEHRLEPQTKGEAPFGLGSNGKLVKEYLLSSGQAFTAGAYAEFNKTQGGPTGVSDFGNLGKLGKAVVRAFFEELRLSYVGEPGQTFDDDLRSYAFAEQLDGKTGAVEDAYQPVIQSRKSRPKFDLETAKKRYLASIELLPDREDMQKTVKAKFEAAVKALDPEKSEEQAGGELRDAIRGALLPFYTKKDGKDFQRFYSELVKGAKKKGKKPDEEVDAGVFGSSFQGNFFELIVREVVPGIVKERQKPIFLPEKGPQVGALDKGEGRREGDGILFIKEGGLYVIMEAKGYSEKTIPDAGDEEKMELYNDVIRKGEPAYFNKKTGTSVQTHAQLEKLRKDDEDVIEEVRFKRVHYYFPVQKVADTWIPKLKDNIDKTRYAVFVKAASDLAEAVAINPTIEFKLPNDGKLQHQLVSPKIKHNGITFRRIDVTLKGAGDPAIASGLLVMDMAVPGFEPKTVEKPIVPIEAPALAEKPKAGAKATPQGRAENKIQGVDSKLKKFLDKIETDARLTDDGVEVEVGIKPGTTAIGGFNVKEAKLVASLGKSGLKAKGKIGVAHSSGKFEGEVAVEWKKNAWTFDGKVTVKDLVEGLEPFNIKIHHGDDGTKVTCEEITVRRKFGAITLEGSVKDATYDTDKGTFSGTPKLVADLGAFGEAKAEAVIEGSQLKSIQVTYESSELAYPPQPKAKGKGKSRGQGSPPIIKGKVKGALAYQDGKFSGSIVGDAKLNVPALDKIAKGLSDLGLEVKVDVQPDGSYSGSVKSTQPIVVGKHFRVPTFEAIFAPDGSLSADVAVEIVDVRFVKDAKLRCKIDQTGFHILEAKLDFPFGAPNKDRLWGSLALAYSEAKGFSLAGELHAMLKEGLVANGTLTYDSKTQKIDTRLSVDEITLLKYGPKQHTLLSFNKQITLVSLYGILGLYLDAGFDLTFNYEFNLRIKPSVALKGFSLQTFEFESAEAKVVLLGLMIARLIGTPKVGLGLYALSPKLLRGGGGIKVPVIAEAKLVPAGAFVVSYTPQGGVKGAVKIGLVLTFGVRGSIRPYAEFSVLNGAYEPKWEGDSLADFVILPERELFTYVIDFGESLETEENPKIPTSPEAPKKPAADRQIGTDKGGPTREAPVDAQKKDPPEGAKSEEAGGEKGGFDFVGLVKSLLGGGSWRKVGDILDAAAGAWEKIKNFVGAIVTFFRNWFGSIGAAVGDVIRGIKEHGLFGYLKIVLRKYVGETIYDIIEPLLNALGNLEEIVLGLLEKPIPKSPGAFFEWAVETLKGLIKKGFGGIVEVAEAFGVMLERARAATGRFLNYLVQNGKIGVRRHVYHFPPYVHYFYAASEYKIHLGGFNRYFRQEGSLTNPESAVGILLYEILRRFPEVKVTNTDVDSDVGSPYNDYWVGGE